MTFALRYLDEKSGQKSMIKGFLSVTIWQPVQKLTFILYMFHPIVAWWYLKDFDIPFYYSIWNAVAYLTTLIVVTFAFAFVLYVFMEQPTALLISAVMKRLMGGKMVPKRVSLKKHPSRIVREMKHHPSAGAGFVDVEPSQSSQSHSETESESDLDDRTEIEDDLDTHNTAINK